jgi:hypothetical protein
VDTGHHGAKLHLVVIAIVRSFKNWKWFNLWQFDFGNLSKGFEKWGRANKNRVLSRNKW